MGCGPKTVRFFSPPDSASWVASGGVGSSAGLSLDRPAPQVGELGHRPPVAQQGELFGEDHRDDKNIFINERCRIQTSDGYRVVTACGVVIAHYAVIDRMSEANAMVTLVDQGLAQQRQVARAFNCDERTVRRQQKRFEGGGLVALGRSRGYPQGRPRRAPSRTAQIGKWKAEGVATREIARRLGVTEKAVRKVLRRIGWQEAAAEQVGLPLGDADPKLSGFAVSSAQVSGDPTERLAPLPDPGADPKLSGSVDSPTQESAEPSGKGLPQDEASSEAHATDADPNVSDDADAVPSLDRDPSNRELDRLLACMGVLDDAKPLFRPGTGVHGAGVLLAVPAVVASGVLEIARDIYGGIGPAFYGLRTTIVTLVLMALLRIKRAEGLKERSPQELGRVLGLDRAPEVKTVRRKIARLSAHQCAAKFGQALAERRVATHGHAMGFLYVDGHVRAYHGKRTLPKQHVARIRLSMPATTDYWVGDAQGDPLFVVTTEADPGLVKMLPGVLDENRALVGERRVTVVFDRGGWSPKLFKTMIASGFDILTYRKGKFRRLAKKCFSAHEATFDGEKVKYMLAEKNILLLKRKLKLRQVTRLSDDGQHQTPILTSRWDLSTVEVAYRMFARWRQENFFKYLREEFALDALVDYGEEPANSMREVPNPKRKELDAQMKKARVEFTVLAAQYGAEAFDNPESVRRTMRGFKIANAPLGREILEVMDRIRVLEKRRTKVPTRVPVKQATKADAIKLRVERKHLTDILKMVAYQIEGDLLRLVTQQHYKRQEDEGRTLVQNALSTAGDIEITDDELRVVLEPLSSPHRTQALVALCEQLNDTKTKFPGSKLRLRFEVKPQPLPCMAFPGPRAANDTESALGSGLGADAPQPDISAEGRSGGLDSVSTFHSISSPTPITPLGR